MKLLCYSCDQETFNANQGQPIPKCGQCGSEAVEIIDEEPQATYHQ